MTTTELGSSDVKVMLWHMALLGLAAITEDAGMDVRVSWTYGMTPRAKISAAGATATDLARAVLAHARQRADGSWVQRDVELRGAARGLMSPRLAVFVNDNDTRTRIQQLRHDVIDTLTDEQWLLDLRLLGALGEPCYWSRNRNNEPQQDDGASRLEMQPRNQGSEFVGSRLRKLAEAVAARDLPDVLAGLTGELLRDEAGKDSTSSRTATGFANPGPTDNTVAWCALWGISQLPTVPRVNTTAITSGHLGRTRREWFYLPYWTDPWRPARLRSILAAARLRTAAREHLDDARETPELLAARSWLYARGVRGVVVFPIERFGSDNAPERRAMLGRPLSTAPS